MIDSDLSHLSLSDPRLYDRLVDGELTEAQRRSLVLRMEASVSPTADPGALAWRQCALAFLEAQEWRHACGTVIGEGRLLSIEDERTSQAPEEAPTTASSAPRRRRWWEALALGAALAASFLVAFNVGLRWQERGHRGAQPDPAAVAVSPSPTAPRESFAVTNPRPQPQEPVPVDVAPQTPPGANLPVTWVGGQQSDDMVRALKRAGYEVYERQHVVPFDLPGGQQILLPVQQYEFHLKGDIYQ